MMTTVRAGRARLGLLCAAVVAAALATAPMAPAVAGDGNGWGSDHTETQTTITGQQQQQEIDDIVSHGVGSDGTWTPPSQWPEYRYVPSCSSNAPEGGADALCGAATMTCGLNAAPGTLRYWVYKRTVFADGREPTAWQQVGSRCIGPDEPRNTTPQVTSAMVVRVARAMTPQVQAHVEPAVQSYVNVPNNYYADAPSITRTVHLFGHGIAIRFTAGEPVWDFGDGSSGSGSGIEGAAVGESGAVEHAYQRQGAYAVTVSASYEVSFTLPDGQQVTQQLTGRPGPAADLRVGEVQTQVTSIG